MPCWNACTSVWLANTLRKELLASGASRSAGVRWKQRDEGDGEEQMEVSIPQQCAQKVFRGIQIHDVHPNRSCCSDLSNSPEPTVQRCSELCCAHARCAAFFHTAHQLSSAGNCSMGGPCCWLKPTWNSSRLHDRCVHPADCVSGILVPPPPPLPSRP
jgi:hypothetical protein